MRLTLLAIGKLKAGPDRDLFDRYWKRCESSGRAIGVTGVQVIELSESRAATAGDRKSDEAARLLKATGPDAFIIALDEAGTSLTSAEFAKLLSKAIQSGKSPVALMIGGPDGHDETVRQHARHVVSLGKMTLPHGLARIVLAEQLYRSCTILTGHPYHRA